MDDPIICEPGSVIRDASCMDNNQEWKLEMGNTKRGERFVFYLTTRYV